MTAQNWVSLLHAVAGEVTLWGCICTWLVTKAIGKMTPENRAVLALRFPNAWKIIGVLAGLFTNDRAVTKRLRALAIATKDKDASIVIDVFEDDEPTLLPPAPTFRAVVLPETVRPPPPVPVMRPPAGSGRFFLAGDDIPAEAQPKKEPPNVPCRNNPRRIDRAVGSDRIG